MVFFRIFLHEVCEGLTNSDLDTAKFYCRDQGVSRMKLDSMNTPQDMFRILEQAQLVSEHNLSFLKIILEQLERDDLLRKLRTLEGNQSMMISSACHLWDGANLGFPSLARALTYIAVSYSHCTLGVSDN